MPAVVLLVVWGVTCPSRPCMQISPVATVALGALAKKLLEVCKNPMQPHFNHFLFESVAALIHFGASSPQHWAFVSHWHCPGLSSSAVKVWRA